MDNKLFLIGDVLTVSKNFYSSELELAQPARGNRPTCAIFDFSTKKINPVIIDSY